MPSPRKRKPARPSRSRRRPPWALLDDEELLGWRICDLGLRIEGSPLAPRVERLYEDLERKGIGFRPPVWLSNEWFSPDGVPGIAAPFYLVHPRLARLEGRQMLQVEGGTKASCQRILRHEAGHALDTAYGLHKKKSWREVFGPYSRPYPQFYRPRPASRSFVLHLDAWYAQAHPAEDFAETFAVWLTPGSSWREAYRDWPAALRKLQYVDRIMRELRGVRPRVRARGRVEPVAQTRLTLAEHYKRKRRYYGVPGPSSYDQDLQRVFPVGERGSTRPHAAAFLREIRPELRLHVSRGTGAHPYTVDQVIQDLIERCRELKLRVADSRAVARMQALVLLTAHVMGCMRGRRHEIAV